MHLFIIDQYITLDMFAPIIYKLSKKKNKTFIYNFNYVQSFKNEKKFSFLFNKKNIVNIKIINFFNIVLLSKFLFIYFVSKLPEKIVKKLFNFWRNIYARKILISEKKFIRFIKENKIKTISIDESLPEIKRYFIINLKKKCSIKIIVIHGGLHTFKVKHNIDNFLNRVDYYLSPGKIPIHSYDFKITPHSGENKFRTKQVDYTGKPRYSKTAKYMSSSPVISLDGDKFRGSISFEGGATLYEIYDKYGTIVKRGFGQTLDISSLGKGTHYVSFDNVTETVQFK